MEDSDLGKKFEPTPDEMSLVNRIVVVQTVAWMASLVFFNVTGNWYPMVLLMVLLLASCAWLVIRSARTRGQDVRTTFRQINTRVFTRDR